MLRVSQRTCLSQFRRHVRSGVTDNCDAKSLSHMEDASSSLNLNGDVPTTETKKPGDGARHGDLPKAGHVFEQVNAGADCHMQMEDASSSSSNGEVTRKESKKKIDGMKHPLMPKAIQPSVRKNRDGSWGPTGLYGGRIKETKLLNTLRNVLKPSRLKRVEEVLSARSIRVQCLFENLHDPANGAACLRTMEAFGVLKAHAVESYEPFKVSGGITMNADKWMVVSKYRHCLDAANALKEQGFTLVATCLDDDAVPINEVDFKSLEKICVMFGNEERGLSFALRQVADKKVYIPMSGFSQSFNISVSCAMVLFHLRECGVMVPDLSDEELNELYLKWCLMSTKRSATILRKHKFEDLAPDFL